MERVNHVHIVKVGRGCLIGYVYGMVQGQVPDGECLELGVTGFHSVFLLLVKLAQADCHLAASWAGSRNDYKRTCGLDIIIATESLIGIDKGHVVGIALNDIVYVSLDSKTFESLAEGIGTGLAVIVGDDHRSYQKATALELLPEAQYVHVIGYAQVAAYLVLLNVYGTDYNNYLSIFAELVEHSELTVRLETG